MKYDDVFNKAKEVIGEENIEDYRPAVFSTQYDTFLSGIETCVPDTIMIWLRNGDSVWYRARNEGT